MSHAAQEFGLYRSALYFLAKAGRLRVYGRSGDRRSYVNREELPHSRSLSPRASRTPIAASGPRGVTRPRITAPAGSSTATSVRESRALTRQT